MKTNAEILKAIKYCVNPEIDNCSKCPYVESASCLGDFHTDYVHFLHQHSTDIHIPKAHIDQVYDIYAPKGQVCTVVEEECAELIQAITKYKRQASVFRQDECREDIVEELTHVEIMLRVLMRHLGIDQKEIDAEVLRKAYKDHFDTSDYNIDPNEAFPNRKLGEEVSKGLFPQCFEDGEIKITSSDKSAVIIAPSSKPMFAGCPKWLSAEEVNKILKSDKRDGT